MKAKMFVQGIPMLVLFIALIGAGGVYLSTQSANNLKTVNPINIEQVQPNKSMGVPVLMYHRIEKNEDIRPYPGASIEKTMAVTPEEFKAQLQYIKNLGYTAITYQQLNNFMLNGTGLPEKPIVISFDDGYYSTYQYAYPILKESGIIAEVGVVTGVDCMDNQLGRPAQARHFDWEIAKELDKSGIIKIENHTVTHRNLAELNQKECQTELRVSKESMESKLNKPINIIVYPNGGYSEESINEAKTLGYNIGVSTKEGLNYYKDDTMKIKRLMISHGETGENIIARINNIAASR